MRPHVPLALRYAMSGTGDRVMGVTARFLERPPPSLGPAAAGESQNLSVGSQSFAGIAASLDQEPELARNEHAEGGIQFSPYRSLAATRFRP